MMKRFKWLTLLLACVLFAVACSGSDTPQTADDAAADDSGDTSNTTTTTDDGSDAGSEEDVALAQGSGLTFHMITHSDDGPFWSVVKAGAEAAAADVGVELVWMPGDNDRAQMVIDIETAISQGSDGIAASLPSPDQLIGPLQEAVAAGINICTINSGANDYQTIGAITHVGQTEFIAGQGTAAVCQSSPDPASSRQRTQPH